MNVRYRIQKHGMTFRVVIFVAVVRRNTVNVV